MVLAPDIYGEPHYGIVNGMAVTVFLPHQPTPGITNIIIKFSRLGMLLKVTKVLASHHCDPRSEPFQGLNDCTTY